MFSTLQFTYNKATKTLVAEASSLGFRPGIFPRSIEVKSHHTGQILYFVYDHEDAEKNEFWDGEMMSYRPAFSSKTPHNVKHLVLLND